MGAICRAREESGGGSCVGGGVGCKKPLTMVLIRSKSDVGASFRVLPVDSFVARSVWRMTCMYYKSRDLVLSIKNYAAPPAGVFIANKEFVLCGVLPSFAAETTLPFEITDWQISRCTTFFTS